jgi:hypothetical protein
MGLRKFIHDFVGYRGANKELHGMLCVIEAHIWDNPKKWPETKIQVKIMRKDIRDLYYNSEKEIAFGWGEVWIKRAMIWDRVLLTNMWEARIERLFHFMLRNATHEEWLVEHEATQRKRTAQKESSVEIVERFKQRKPTPPWGNSGVKV